MTTFEQLWYLVGLGGQALFASRMIVQWIASERQGRTVVPVAFWYLSLVGGTMLMCYGFWRREPVIIFGQTPGLIVYARNLVLHYRPRKMASPVVATLPLPAEPHACPTCGRRAA